MKNAGLSSKQQDRFGKVCELARTARNLTMTLVEPHRNPYRDLSFSQLSAVEENVKCGFMDAIHEDGVPVLISADENVKSAISFEFAEREKSRGSVLRLVATNKRWFENNWKLFAGDFGFGTRRSLFVFLKPSGENLARLVAPWWDPDVLLNPHIASSRALLKEVETRIKPGMIVFSLTLVRLSSCQLYFHAEDVDSITTCVCAAAQKTKWWK